ncbi:NrdJb [Chromatium okenii]|uniref:TSCPD domain-containing protein n=1 Tax=Chromatium okenii TaxID=61644 RepID=UPI0026F1E7B5|nr:NrdJb [Chromatium okenii]MBV5309035.1 NrdJb [Chromatium okenii]
MLKIDKKIVGYKVVDKTEEPVVEAQLMHELLPRPNCLTGTTYKVKTPQSEHALYITINDMVLDGVHHPYEMFINSKNMDHFQWVLALTRLVSAVWRKGGDSTFLVEELKNVFDPKGGYYKRGGVYMPSLVAEIGTVIEQHLKSIGVIKVEVDEHQQAFIKAKREEVMGSEESGYPANATLCDECNTKAVIVMDNCKVCLNCASSKCG